MILKADEKRPATHLSGREMSLKLARERPVNRPHCSIPRCGSKRGLSYHLKYDTGLRDANNTYIRIYHENWLELETRFKAKLSCS